jgi:hypothetical protein
LEAGFVEHPLDGAVEKDGVVEVGDLTVEPEVDAGDGGGFEVGDFFAEWCAVGSLRENFVEGVEGKGED